MNQEQIIEKINVVAFDVKCVSGTVSRDARDDTAIFTPGSVRYIDPTHLRAFTSARQAGNRACRARGVRFLSGWAVPDESLETLMAELNAISSNVATAKTDLEASWATHVNDWVAAHPQVDAYRGRFPNLTYVSRQTGASLSVYRIQSRAVESAAEDGVKAEVTGLANRVLCEIAQDVQDTWKPGAMQASQRIKNLLKRLSNKCRTLGFLGGDLGGIANFIDEAILRLPTEGAISGPDFVVLSGILDILSSPEKMTNAANMAQSDGIFNKLEAQAHLTFVGKAESSSEPETSNNTTPGALLAETAGQEKSSPAAWDWGGDMAKPNFIVLDPEPINDTPPVALLTKTAEQQKSSSTAWDW